MLALGARAVQLGTRFVVTEECDVDPAFKARYLAARAEDIVLTKTPVGLWGRVLRTPLIAGLEADQAPGFKCHYKCLEVCDAHTVRYCIADVLLEAATGEGPGLTFIGANGPRCDEILPVAELLRRLTTPAA
jgi:NAD(P)H-dependent flavin oxidoreductase YrpB (nitropropane dioxygenase family)